MNWKDPMILGLLAGSGAFKYRHPKSKNRTLVIGSLNKLQRRPNNIKDSTLIARSISSMTEEEEEKLNSCSGEDIRYETTDGVTWFIETPESFLYLISIGIWIGSTEDVEFIHEHYETSH